MFGKPPPPPPPPPTLLEFFTETNVTSLGLPAFLRELSIAEGAVLTALVVFITYLNLYAARTPLKKAAVLDLKALNRVNMVKECFLAYVNAGMLEPILAIASADYDVSLRSAYLNLLQLAGLFSWLYLLTDAFDISDTQQLYVYWVRVRKEGASKLPSWYQPTRSTEAEEVKGTLMRDVSLWFMLACSALAFAGLVSHRDVIHSHAVILLCVVLHPRNHHQTRKATAWRGLTTA